jgi:hypothetical protein
MKYRYSVRTGISKIKTRTSMAITAAAIGFGGAAMAVAIPLGAQAAGFDSYGYNNTARIFNGTNGSWCEQKGLDASTCATYGNPNDKLVMKWNSAWVDCNLNGTNDPSACSGAWLTNELNGKVANGSNTTEHYKIVWINSSCDEGATLSDGGTCVWGHYEIVMDQGTANGVHKWYTHALPNGFGTTH